MTRKASSRKTARMPASRSSGKKSVMQPRPTPAELYTAGKKLRERVPRTSHAAWKPSRNRPDPLQLMQQSNKGRIPDLIPIRHGRMLRTPFTFYRGAALNMAADLSTTPATGLRVQACGDCHLMNFGAFATPERRLVFDINDMDETLPAPWEWDVKRLAASFVLACRNNGFSADVARDAVLSCVCSYREHIAAYSKMPVLEVWYSSIDVEKVLSDIQDEESRKRVHKRVALARKRSVLEHDFPKLAAMSGQSPTIKDHPPLIYHPRDPGEEKWLTRAQRAYGGYRESLQDDRRVLIDRYELKDVAIKVVGVGSVGTLCAVMLMMASNEDPLFLQVKEARQSVLEPYAGKSVYPNHGQRVVNGYRLIQSASDIFLGWTRSELGRDFYIRQLRDMKLSPLVELFSSAMMVEYGEVCGRTLARAHARAGAPAMISGYLGNSDTFDKAIATFATAYADQSEHDHDVLMKAARAGKIEVAMEPE